MIIVNNDIQLRPFRPDDAEAIVPLANNINVAKNLRNRFPHPYSIDDAHWFINHIAGQSPPQNLVIEYQGSFAGAIGIMPGKDIHYRTAEIGYWLGEPFWGKGIMTEAVNAATEHFMKTFNLVRVFALPKGHNIASHRVLEKAGYVFEGVLRKNYEKAVEIGDSYMYAYVI